MAPCTVMFKILLLIAFIHVCMGAPNCFEHLCRKINGKYPRRKINKLLKKNEDTLGGKIHGAVVEPGIEQRILKSNLSSVEPENLCKSRRYTFIPKYDVGANLTIVNVPNYQQILSFEVCSEKNSLCAKALPHFHYQMMCKQLYNNIRLLYLTDDNQLQFKLFTVPNACVCMYTKSLYNKETRST